MTGDEKLTKVPFGAIHSPSRDYHEVRFAFKTQAEARAFRDAISPNPFIAAPAGLTQDEQKAQAQRCGCKGSDDYCPCQNAPDQVTSAGLAALTKAQALKSEEI